MPNRLTDAGSPYLLQHADNPVDWFPWGEEAFAAARERDLPILLSVGYAACHWCHVMAHESFEDPDTAAYMNAHFVNVKVDREERPDVDRVYMDAVQATTGRGGWPMTVFLTPDGRPIFAGTYFPKEPRPGLPAFRDVLRTVAEAWRTRREELVARSDRLAAAIGRTPPPDDDLPGLETVRAALDRLAASFDRRHGGFGGAPKFPQAPTLELLMRAPAILGAGTAADAALAMLSTTLDHMARGGIYDHIQGGFARYATDDRWLVPHFEKMLYDNALLARVYLRSWQLTGRDEFRRVAEETLAYLRRDLRDPSGALHSAEDADAGGVEGGHATWSWEELGETLGPDREIAAVLYGATAEGDLEGRNVLHLPEPLPLLATRLGTSEEELLALKATIDDRLRARRRDRIPPARDDKLVTAWNGLALRAFAEAAAVLDDRDHLATAAGIAAYLTGPAAPEGRLLRSRRGDRAGPPAFCDDYAATAVGLYTLFAVTGEERWYAAAEDLVVGLRERFADPDGGFFGTAADAEPLVARPKNLMDDPTPSDNALAAEALALHVAYTGDDEARRLLEGTVRAAGAILRRHPGFAGHLLAVWGTVRRGVDEVAIVGPPGGRRPLAAVIWERFRPGVVLAPGDGGPTAVPLLTDRTPGPDAAAYVCRNMVCDLPARTPAELRSRLTR